MGNLTKTINVLSPSVFPTLNADASVKTVEAVFSNAIDTIRLNQIKLVLAESEVQKVSLVDCLFLSQSISHHFTLASPFFLTPSSPQTSYRRKLKQRLQVLLSRPSATMWDEIRRVHQDTIRSISAGLAESLPQYGLSESVKKSNIVEFETKSLAFAKETVEDFVRNLDSVLERHFKV